MIFENITSVTTNSVNNSILEVNIPKLTFENLLNKFPSDSIEHINSKTKKDEFGDHCAINVSESLYLNKIKLKSFKGARCYSKCPSGENIHAIRAQELATWLNKQPFAGCPKAMSFTGENFEQKIDDKTGIIFFQDYWQRSGEKGEVRTGDHIDLWNKNKAPSLVLYSISIYCERIMAWAELDFYCLGHVTWDVYCY